MKGIPAILLMLTIFAGGCSIASVDKPFDHSLMQRADEAVSAVVPAANMAPEALQDEGTLRPLVNMVWAKYYAGNVALGKGETQEAEELLQDVLELATEIFRMVREAVRKQFGSLTEGSLL